ncbi:hypothetical protein ACOSQ3_022841 [Xanthoceras sorbifolium]
MWSGISSKAVVGSPAVSASSWLPPPSGCLKLNTDATIRSNSGWIGAGAVIRNEKGWVVAVSSRPIQGFFSVVSGELIALRDGLLLAKRLGLLVQWVEVDSSSVIFLVKGATVDFDENGCVVSDILALFKDVGVLNVMLFQDLEMIWPIA